MSNDPKADLIYAILAMDSYNRGYGKGIDGLDDEGANATIGNYLIVQNIAQTNWFNTGFYAIAYQQGTETIISYRGTDFNANLPTSIFDILDGSVITDPDKGGSDALNGYGLALGRIESDEGSVIGELP